MLFRSIKFTFDTSIASGCSGTETLPGPTWSCAPARVTAVTLSDGTLIPYTSATYTMSVTDFTNSGGDSYFMLADGQGTTRDRDANVFLAYMGVVGPALDPTTFPLDRITCTLPCAP